MSEFTDKLHRERAKLPALPEGLRWKPKFMRSAEDRVDDAVYVDKSTVSDSRVYIVVDDSVIIYEQARRK